MFYLIRCQILIINLMLFNSHSNHYFNYLFMKIYLKIYLIFIKIFLLFILIFFYVKFKNLQIFLKVYYFSFLKILLINSFFQMQNVIQVYHLIYYIFFYFFKILFFIILLLKVIFFISIKLVLLKFHLNLIFLFLISNKNHQVLNQMLIFNYFFLFNFQKFKLVYLMVLNNHLFIQFILFLIIIYLNYVYFLVIMNF